MCVCYEYDAVRAFMLTNMVLRWANDVRLLLRRGNGIKTRTISPHILPWIVFNYSEFTVFNYLFIGNYDGLGKSWSVVFPKLKFLFFIRTAVFLTVENLILYKLLTSFTKK